MNCSRLRVVPLSLSPSSETRKKRAREKGGRVRSWGREARVHLVTRISRGHFFLADFFRVSQDRLSERETTRCLELFRQPNF